jgi:hypothetical protein
MPSNFRAHHDRGRRSSPRRSRSPGRARRGASIAASGSRTPATGHPRPPRRRGSRYSRRPTWHTTRGDSPRRRRRDSRTDPYIRRLAIGSSRCTTSRSRLWSAVSRRRIQPGQIGVSTCQLPELRTYLEWSRERGGFIEAQALGTLSMEVNGSGGYRVLRLGHQ